MKEVLETIISYFVSLAANWTTDALHAGREARLKRQLEGEEALCEALASTRPLRDELRAACAELTRDRHDLGVTAQEEPLWRLLSDDAFQVDLAEWFMAGGIKEGKAVKERLLQRMETALVEGGTSPEQISFLKTDYFDAVEKSVFANPILANWRHQLSLDYLREQVAVLRQRAEEAAGVYSPEKQKAALDRYCENALAAWDIIDLSNLPEGDIHMATQTLLLRQLYMPLRIEVEPTRRGEGDDAALARLEEQREARRRREAGRLFADGADRPDRAKSRAPVGKRLGESRRLVVLGDPGGGKTTMLRWMATAYLLRQKGNDAFSQIPDTQTLPSQPWIPVLIRCRDLCEADLCQCFTDFLTVHLNKTELLPEEAKVMRAVILERIAKGEVLLLVDGLDEITNPQVRMMFCQELERTAARYPDAPIVVTSRIVGYRDMPYRMGAGFEHGQIAELNREDKDLFAQRWVEVTEQHQPAAERARRVEELRAALHSNDRIERLTGNPMLLTTLALVKRKVGKLPNRRNKLYAEAISTLLNWNPRVHQIIEEDEAIPQLGYIAYEMCRRGVQQLTGDEVLDLLEKVRTEYPNVRPICSREPQAFLALLEERSSILIKSGGIWQKNTTQEKAVWEFRHLTFQEYLAARALLDGRYPGREKGKLLAQQVAPLAGAVEKAKHQRPVPESEGEVDVPESWREALRLLVAGCKDDDVNDVLLAILNPMASEDAAQTGRPRAVLAALCLADEPYVSNESAEQVLSTLAAKVQKDDGVEPGARTSIDRAVIEIGDSTWSPLLKKSLIQEYCRRPSDARWNVGSLWGMAEVTCWRRSGTSPRVFFAGLVQRLKSGDRVEVISAALTIMEAAYEGSAEIVEGLPESLLDILAQTDLPASNAAAWALGWLSRGSSLGWLSRGSHYLMPEGEPVWLAKGNDVNRVSQALDATPTSENSTRRWLVWVLGCSKDSRALFPLMRRLDDPNVRRAVAEALGQLGDKQAVAPLMAKLDDPDVSIRRAVIEALGRLGDKQAVPPLLAKLDDPDVSIRRAVIEVLGQLGGKHTGARLLAKLDDPDYYVRRAVAEVLGRLGDKQAVPSLLAKLDDPDASLRQAVIEALGRLGDKQAVPSLLAKLDDPDADVRTAVAEVLGRFGDKQAVPSLLAKLDDPDADVRTAVAEVLGQLGDKQAVPSLLAKLDDPDADVRTAVAEVLGQLGDKQAVDPLILLLEDRDHQVCAAAAAALTVLGDRGSNRLAEFLSHDSPERRKAAVKELVRIRGKAKEGTLLSRDLDGTDPWIDPRTPITETRVEAAARRLGLTTDEARSVYQSIAADFQLVLERV